MKRRLSFAATFALLTGILVLAPTVLGSAAVGPNVKVTDDNNNVDGGIGNVTPSKDAQNRQANETTVAISTVPSPVTGVPGDIVAESANDYRMAPHFGDTWMPIYLSFDGGTTWYGAPPALNGYNTMVPGFPTDTSAAGQASPLLGLDGAGDPVIRFDRQGNLLVGGIAFNRNRDPGERPLDTVSFVARYHYTPGSPATASTPTSAGSPPHFTYQGTTIVDRGAVGFAVASGFAGNFTDKPWMEVDLNTPSASPCSGYVYFADTNFHGQRGSSPVVFMRSTDGGVTWSSPRTISTGGPGGASHNQGADIAVAPNGTIYVAFEAFSSQGVDTINLVKSTDCGSHWTQPVVVSTIDSSQAPGVAFRTPTFAFLATDTTNSNLVYAVYQNLVGDYDIYARRSLNGGSTWSAAVQVNDDPGARHQIFPTIEVSHGTLSVAWYDFRNSTTPINEALDVYYSCTGCNGLSWPTFDAPTRVTPVSHNPECRMFGGGTVAFHGDYIELDAFWNGATNIVHVVWADNRDVPVAQCDLSDAPGPATNNIGNRNQNIYEAKLTVAP
ncbi:MAG: sialidase family protein [Actinomycetota bacterium]